MISTGSRVQPMRFMKHYWTSRRLKPKIIKIHCHNPVSATISAKVFVQIKHYNIDSAYAERLAQEPAYRDTTVAKLHILPMPKTLLTGIVENIGEGLTLVSDEPIALDAYLVADITVPGISRPLRALCQVERTDADYGKVVDRTIQTYKSNLKVLAINKDDIKRIENDIIESKIKESSK
jgi:hypothetical protein